MPLPSLNPTADKGSFSQRFLEKASKVKDTSEKWLSTIFGDSSMDSGGGSKSKLGKDNKKNPQRTSIGSGSSTRLKMGDSIADIMAKQYIFMQRAYEAQKQEDELNVALRKEQMDEDERRHRKLIEELVKAKQPTAVPEKEEEEKKQDDSWIKKMLGGIKDSLFTVLKGLLNAIMSPLKLLTSLVSSIMGIVTSIATSLAKTVFKVIAEGASGIVKLLLLPLTSLISGIVANAFKALYSGISSLGSIVSNLLGPIGKVIATLIGVAYADASYRQEEQKETHGEEYSKIQDEYIDQEIKDNLSVGEQNLRRAEIQKRTDERNARSAKARAQYEKETLIPKMEEAGYKPSRGPSEKPGAPLLTFKNEEGQTANLMDIKKALYGEDWMQKELMKMVFGESKSFKEMASGEIEKINTKLESEMAKTKKDYIDPLITPITDKLKEIEERMEGLQNNFGAKLESLKQINDDYTKGLNTKPNPPPATNSSVTISGSSNNNIGGGNEIQNGDYMQVRHDAVQKNIRQNLTYS
jgi:hypothetical protein